MRAATAALSTQNARGSSTIPTVATIARIKVGMMKHELTAIQPDGIGMDRFSRPARHVGFDCVAAVAQRNRSELSGAGEYGHGSLLNLEIVFQQSVTRCPSRSLTVG